MIVTMRFITRSDGAGISPKTPYMTSLFTNDEDRKRLEDREMVGVSFETHFN